MGCPPLWNRPPGSISLRPFGRVSTFTGIPASAADPASLHLTPGDAARGTAARQESGRSMRYALTGRVVTVDEAWTVLEHGAVYIADDRIVRVLDAAEPAPDGFADAAADRDPGHDLPGPDRAPQPPELQRAAALAAGAGVPEPRGVAGRAGLPQVGERPDDGPRQDRRPVRGGRPLRRVQVPRRWRHDLAGHRALQQQRHRGVLPRQHPQRRVDR